MSLGPDPLPGGETDLRPVVVRRRRDPLPWIFGAAALLGAVLLFGALDAQRRDATAPAVFSQATGVSTVSSPPPLYIAPVPPPPPPPPPPEPLPPSPTLQVAMPPAPPAPPRVAPVLVSDPRPSLQAMPQPVAPSLEPPRQSGSAVVYDRSPRISAPSAAQSGATAGESAPTRPTGRTEASGGRTRALQLRQLQTTVPQGVLIPAVLETALDSTRAGFVRAMVTQDVRGFDGSRVLIPRGSRLFGEYEADMAPGQRRAFVRWTRLVRPDGVAVALDSPAADGLGRAGIAGRVDNHFVERFASALLQSTVNLGTALAGRSAGNGSIVVALPGAAQPAPGTATPGLQPTLRVEAGTTVTAFVAHDLVLPPIETAR